MEIGQEFLQKVTTGNDFKPNYSSTFPANLISTELDWSDLVLENHVFDEIDIIDTWLKNKMKFLKTSSCLKINKGYKCLFFGPPGTENTLRYPPR